MYLTFARYKELGGTTYRTESDFTSAESRAEAYIDEWTIGRAKDDAKRGEFASEVERATFEVVEMAKAIDAAIESATETDGVLKSFSNGTDSATFADAPVSEGVALAETVAKRRAMRFLPVELVSACVTYNR